MLLVIDIGNSHITLGAYNNKELEFVTRLRTDNSKTEDQFAIELKDITELYNISRSDITDSVVSSVVPELTGIIVHAISKAFGIEALVLGPGVKTGINIQIDNPAQLGADIVAGAVSAVANYPTPCIMFDFGTATTVFAIGKNGAVLGGSICAGVRITLESLYSKTALLPHISIEKPPHAIGKNTVASMQSGLVYGTAAMMDGMADRMQAELGEKATLIATGGLAKMIIPACTHEFILDENLLLDGLRIIYEKNRKYNG